jgi:hypothetical protein
MQVASGQIQDATSSLVMLIVSQFALQDELFGLPCRHDAYTPQFSTMKHACT